MEVDKTDVGDEDHAREDAAFWMASRGCIPVQSWVCRAGVYAKAGVRKGDVKVVHPFLDQWEPPLAVGDWLVLGQAPCLYKGA